MQGVETGEDTDTAMDTNFLMEQMELRESLAEAREAADRHVRLESLRRRVNKEFEERSDLLHTYLAENAERARQQARNLVREMQFLQKLAHEIEELE